MALTRDKKEEVVAKITDLFKESKLTVIANYSGITVTEIQQLRQKAKEQDVKFTVAKNRLTKLALKNTDLKDVDLSILEGQLALAFGLGDEVAPAQVLANFAKDHEALELVGAISSEGEVLSADQVNELAKLPNKETLRGQVVGTIAAPLSGFVNVMQGNLRGVVNVLDARRAQLES